MDSTDGVERKSGLHLFFLKVLFFLRKNNNVGVAIVCTGWLKPRQAALLKQLQICTDVLARVDADDNDGLEQQQKNIRQTTDKQMEANFRPEKEPLRGTGAAVITDPRLISAGGTQMRSK